MIVVDAPVLADALVDDGAVGDAARTILASDPHWAAPAHLGVKVVSVIRGKTVGGKLGIARAEEALDALRELVIDYVDPAQLIDRMWRLRETSLPSSGEVLFEGQPYPVDEVGSASPV